MTASTRHSEVCMSILHRLHFMRRLRKCVATARQLQAVQKSTPRNILEIVQSAERERATVTWVCGFAFGGKPQGTT